MSKLKPRDLHKLQRRRAATEPRVADRMFGGRKRVRRTLDRTIADYFRNGGRVLEIVYEPSELTKRMLRGKP